MQKKTGIIIFALMGAVVSMAATGAWKATQWQTVFEHVPEPPATLAQAGDMVGVTKNSAGNVSLALTSPTLLQSRAEYHAGMDAIQQAAVDAAPGKMEASHAAADAAAAKASTAGIDVARLQSDPAYAKELQQKMASMSQAQKMQMAMQMAAAQQQSQQAMQANPAGAGMRAGGALVAYIEGTGAQSLSAAESGLRKDFTKLMVDYNARHTALGQKLAAELKACPVLPFNVCHKECGPDLKCLARINARVPALIAHHRKLAAAELADERALLTKTRAVMQPVIAKATQLTVTAEAAGAPTAQRQSGYLMIAMSTSYLQIYTALATLRAGYWQNIKQRTVPDDYLAATSDIGYQYVLAKTQWGDDNLSEPPSDLPKGW